MHGFSRTASYIERVERIDECLCNMASHAEKVINPVVFKGKCCPYRAYPASTFRTKTVKAMMGFELSNQLTVLLLYRLYP